MNKSVFHNARFSQNPEAALKSESGANTVHELQSRIEDALKAGAVTQPIEDDDSLDVINRFLKLTGWVQGPRRVFESLPHADCVESVAAFRAVLFRLGYQTTVEPASAENLRDEYLPCFIRCESGRMLLAEKCTSEGELVLFNPALGKRRKAPAAEIEGFAIFPELENKFDSHSGGPAPKWSTQVLTAFAPVIRQVLILSFAINLFALAPPLFVMSVYDKAIGSKSIDVLVGLVIGVAVIVAADYALRQVRVRLHSYLGARIDEQINEAAFRHLLHLALSYTEDAPIGSQLARLRQMTSIHEAFTGPLANAFFDLPFFFLFLAVIALIGGSLVWVPITLIIAYIVVAAWALPRTSQLTREAGDLKAQLNNLTVEAVSAQRTIRDLAAEHVWLRRQRRLSADASVANMKARRLNFLIQTFSQSMVAVAGIAVLTIGVAQVIAGDLSAGALIAVMALSWRVLGPIRNLFLSGLTLGQTLQGVQQINRLVKMPLEREPDSGPSIPRTFKGHVVFDKITFRYPSQREPALRGVSFDVKPGELLCLYGKSGSGTSTALKVLLGLYQQQAGSIFVDGLDLRQLDKGEWRHALGVGLQNLDLFHGTVAQNIRLARPDASDEQIETIARRLGIDFYYGGALDEGLNTRCSATARATWPDALVSRIILARAFIRDAPVYVLDEPAATLDFVGEKALVSIIEERRKKSAIIMTTQRPSHMRMADKIVWFEGGAIRDIGEPDQLVPKIMAA